MEKKSKLREKPARIATSLEAKRNEDFKQYLRLIAQQNNEAAKALAFSHFLTDWFSNAKPFLLENYLKGIEKSLKKKEHSLVLRGRIDALFGNVIIEFESDLTSKAKLREAKSQLQQYAYMLITKGNEPDTSYLCIATDGLLFYVFVPYWKDKSKFPTSQETIELREIEKKDFNSLNGDQAFLWLDRYLFRTTKLHPTTEEFVRDFGMNSPAYTFALKLLSREWEKVKGSTEFGVIYENWAKYLLIAYGTTVADTELFLRHTYLASFARLLAYMRLAKKAVVPTRSEVKDIFTGKFFKELGIENFIEEDFFTWVEREKVRDALIELTQRISTLLENYNLDEISEDVLKSLYQELVDPETRHDLGEFYTPDWLADRVVRHALKDNPSASVLDPSCGSGSFLYFAIRYKREQLGDSKGTLDHIGETVVGIDIHPLAIIIAKTNYLLGLGELMRKRLKNFHIPVYMANSLRITERSLQPTLGEKVPSQYVEIDNTLEPIPDVFIKHPASFDEAIETCHVFAKEQSKENFSEKQFCLFAKRRITEATVDDETLEVLFHVAKRMRTLIEKERNSIWAFILKNVYRPLLLEKHFDWILGNPPWLAYRYIEKGKYQEFIRNAILSTYGLLGGGKGHLMTHLELGTLFFFASLDTYGRKTSRIGFVLPRSIFTGDQHENFRKSSYGKAIHQTGLTEVWDLEGVAPLFKVPSCVVFGKKVHHTSKPIPTEVLSGVLDGKNASLNDADKLLTKRTTKLHIVDQGNRSFWSEDPNAEIAGTSLYSSKFIQGATIVPRTCWFVEIKANKELGFNPQRPNVKTDQRATDQAKEAYADLLMEGTVEKEFLYATLLSTDLLPFGVLDYRAVVLPIMPSGEKFVIHNAKWAKDNGYTDLAKWLETCEKEWKKRRKEKANKMSIYERLDHVHSLTYQHPNAKYKVVYPTSATNLCSTVIENEKIIKKVGEQKLKLHSFIVESTMYCCDTENEFEAHYLSALLNSHIIDELLKPMQAQGLWGPRHIHKKIWELPIPVYKESKSPHKQLAELGFECAEKVEKIIPTLNTTDVTPGKIGRLRSEVRERLSDELKEIDVLVKKIMGR